MHTHLLTIAGDVVRKQYVSWAAGEADREWAGLTAIDRHVPGLAPAPIAREACGEAPVVVMSRVAGVPLGSTALTGVQVEALGVALRRLFDAPADPAVGERGSGPRTGMT